MVSGSVKSLKNWTEPDHGITTLGQIQSGDEACRVLGRRRRHRWPRWFIPRYAPGHGCRRRRCWLCLHAPLPCSHLLRLTLATAFDSLGKPWMVQSSGPGAVAFFIVVVVIFVPRSPGLSVIPPWLCGPVSGSPSHGTQLLSRCGRQREGWSGGCGGWKLSRASPTWGHVTVTQLICTCIRLQASVNYLNT